MTLEYCPSAAFVHYYIRNTQNDVGHTGNWRYTIRLTKYTSIRTYYNRDKYANVADTLKFEPFIDVINCGTKKPHLPSEMEFFLCIHLGNFPNP